MGSYAPQEALLPLSPLRQNEAHGAVHFRHDDDVERIGWGRRFLDESEDFVIAGDHFGDLNGETAGGFAPHEHGQHHVAAKVYLGDWGLGTSGSMHRLPKVLPTLFVRDDKAARFVDA